MSATHLMMLTGITTQEFEGIIVTHDQRKVEALAFAQQCADILVSQHGAQAEWINHSIFYWSRMGQHIALEIEGKPLQTVATAVAWAVEHIREQFIGLAEPNARQAAQIVSNHIEIGKEQDAEGY